MKRGRRHRSSDTLTSDIRRSCDPSRNLFLLVKNANDERDVMRDTKEKGCLLSLLASSGEHFVTERHSYNLEVTMDYVFTCRSWWV